jgi:hypothetical protein
VTLASFFDITVLSFEKPVHGPNRTIVLSLIEQHGIDLAGRIVLKPRTMEQIDDGSSLSAAQRQRGR